MTIRTSRFRLLAILFAAGLLQNCTSRPDAQTGAFQPVDSVAVEYAEGFSITTYDGYSRIHIFNAFQDASDTLHYVLVPRREALPDSLPAGQVIRTPIEQMIATSTTHIALIDMLDAQEVVAGMVGARYAYSPFIREGVEKGSITAFDEGEFNNEVALNLDPDLVMISAGQASDYRSYQLLVDSGIAVLVNAEWLERTPLGKAEWVKVMGALLDKQTQATEQFQEVARRYNALKEKVPEAGDTPLVINNLPYKGAWFVPGGQSFTAQFLRDAGADYPWYSNESTGGLRLDFETVYEAGLRADVWLNPGSATSNDALLAADERFNDFKPVKNGRVFNNTKRISSGGGNDFWETGVVRPDLILSDLITVLHADTVHPDSLYFYQRLE